MKVEQFRNEKGVPVRNQFILSEEGRGALGNFLKRETFQSYDSIIAVRTEWPDVTRIELDSTYWDYSRTTSKYRAQFLGESTDETRKKIASGEYVLTNLN